MAPRPTFRSAKQTSTRTILQYWQYIVNTPQWTHTGLGRVWIFWFELCFLSGFVCPENDLNPSAKEINLISFEFDSVPKQEKGRRKHFVMDCEFSWLSAKRIGDEHSHCCRASIVFDLEISAFTHTDETIQDGFDRLLKIGEGSYGVVYKAIERQTKRMVALKRIRLDQTSWVDDYFF